MGSGRSRVVARSTEEEELLALLQLVLLPGVGDRKLTSVLRSHGSAKAVFRLPSGAFSVLLGRSAAGARREPSLHRRAAVLAAECRELGLRVVAAGRPDYPSSLLALSDPPAVLFLRGDASLLDGPRVAVVGSRKASPVGRRTSERIARELSRCGVTVVSGLALGIDGAAHRGALDGSGRTIAVLGSGPHRSYPVANRTLFERILDRGLIVSEFPPGEPARPYHFPRRNRVIAGLSSGVVVVEASARSGALITVDHALDLGLDVFSVPGSVELPQAAGANALLKDGAHLATSGADVLDVLASRSLSGMPFGLGTRSSKTGVNPLSTSVTGHGSTSDLDMVARALGRTPRTIDRLVSELELPVERVLAVLTRMELSGSVVRTGEGWREGRASS